MKKTVPTIISQVEYENAYYAVDRNNDIWLLWGEESCLYLGNDKKEWKNTMEAIGHDYGEIAEICVTDPQGCKVYVEALTCPMKLCNMQLDLKALEDGFVEWC